jgi:hypothetical protein
MPESEHLSLLQNIRELKRHEPFAPFLIVMASGDKYRIENGENLVEMRTEFFYATPGSDQFVLIRMNQIVAVERLGDKRSSRRKKSA